MGRGRLEHVRASALDEALAGIVEVQAVEMANRLVLPRKGGSVEVQVHALCVPFLVGDIVVIGLRGHGIHKVIHGVGDIQAVLRFQGLPGVLSYGVYVGELVAPALIILGAFTRPAAGVLAFTMMASMYLKYSSQFNQLTALGGWGAELPALYLFAAVAIVLLGPGRFSVGKRSGLLN